MLAYLVIGTVSPAAITLTPLFAMSIGVLIFAGFVVGVMIVRRLPAKLTGEPRARPFVTSFWGFDVSADSRTSAGAPCSILVSSADEESVEMVSVMPGFAASYAVF